MNTILLPLLMTLAAVAADPAGEPPIAVTDTATLPVESSSWGTLQWVCNAKLMPGAEQTVGLATILPGKSNPMHFHPNCEEVLHVLSGQGTHSIDGRTVVLKAGMTIRIPAGAKHNLVNTGTQPLKTLVSFSSGDRKTVLLSPGELPIRVLDDKTPGSLHLWHLYERTDATATVGQQITFVGRVRPGETEIACADPPWITVAFSNEKKPGADRPDTFQAFAFQCDRRPEGLDAAGFAQFTGKVLVNRPELTTNAKYDKNIPVFRIEFTKVAPIPCRRSPEELQRAAAADVRGVEARLRKLCADAGLQYDFDDSKLAPSWHQGHIALTSIVSRHPRFSFTPVPYATISVLYKPETGEPAGFVFTRRIWQDPHD